MKLTREYMKKIWLNDCQIESEEKYESMDIMFYIRNNYPCMSIWYGTRAAKPRIHERYFSADDRAKRLEDYKEIEKDRIAAAEKKKKEKDELRASLKKDVSKYINPGDIYYTSWGYDQTNVDFYQVTRVKGCYAWLRELKHETRQTHSMAGYTKPVKDKFLTDSKEIRKKILIGYNNDIQFKMSSWGRYADKWDREETYYSEYA